jgi:hypothetical protein
LEYSFQIKTGGGANKMNPIKAGEAVVTITEAVAPEATKIAESAAQKLLEAGGVLAPPIRSEAVSVGVSSLGGKLPADLPKYFGHSAEDFQIMNVDKPMPEIYIHEIDRGAHEHISDMALKTVDAHREASLLDVPKIDWQVSRPDSSEWTPAVREMMRKAFLKTEG